MVEGSHRKQEASLKDIPLDAQQPSRCGQLEHLLRTKSGQLSICLTAHERPTALLAWNVVAVFMATGLQRAKVTNKSSYRTFRHTFWDAPERDGDAR